MNFTRAVAVMAIAVLLGGCAPGWRGTVVSGRVTTVATVLKDDPRLAGEGVRDVRITVSGQGGVVRSVSDKNGEFDIRPPKTTLASSSVEITVDTPGYARLRWRGKPPVGDGRWLVILEPSGGVMNESSSTETEPEG